MLDISSNIDSSTKKADHILEMPGLGGEFCGYCFKKHVKVG